MRTREKLLDFFEKNKGAYFSGEELAARLSVSRTAVWKAVNSLRKDGYEIDAVPNKGYCLSADTDILSSQGVEKYLEPVCASIEMEILPAVGSTNDYLREKALKGQKEGFTVLAGEQTGGRGRTGRSFYSPADTGIYMSLLLRPENCSPAVAVKFTTMAAVAACRAIEKVSQKKAQIKWVNDVYIEDKKVCGILTEGAVSLEKGSLEYVILGVGINVYPPRGGFPRPPVFPCSHLHIPLPAGSPDLYLQLWPFWSLPGAAPGYLFQVPDFDLCIPGHDPVLSFLCKAP